MPLRDAEGFVFEGVLAKVMAIAVKLDEGGPRVGVGVGRGRQREVEGREGERSGEGQGCEKEG